MISELDIFKSNLEKKREKLETALKNETKEYKKKQLENKLIMFDKKYNPPKFYYGGGTYVKPNKK